MPAMCHKTETIQFLSNLSKHLLKFFLANLKYFDNNNYRKTNINYTDYNNYRNTNYIYTD